MKKLAMCLITSTALFSACSSDEKKAEVQNEVRQETVVSKDQQKQTTREFITNSKNLTDQQKTDLLALYDDTTKTMKATNDQILQTKTVMIKSLMDPKMDDKKISILRSDLKKLEKKRTDTTLRAFDQAKLIMTPIKDLETKQKLYEDFMIREGHYY